MKHTTLSKSKLRELKLRKKKRAIIASRNVNDCVNNMPKDKPLFDLKVLKKIVFGDNDAHYVQEAKPWKQVKTKQPKRLRHSYKKWKWVSVFSKEQGWHTEYKLVHRKSEYFHKDPVQMSQVSFWEALVKHKTAKWEKKNPRPCQDDDLFKAEMLVDWNDKRDKAVERFRDMIVSAYDKLSLVGRFKVSDGKYKEEEIAKIKDINGEGHVINELEKDSKLLKKTQKIVDGIHAKRMNLVSTNLKDHKRQKGRIICPTTLMMKKAA